MPKSDERASGRDAAPERESVSPLLWIIGLAGLGYPLWPLAAPRGPVDPYGVWLAMSACFLAVPALHFAWRQFDRATLHTLISVLGTCVTLHLFLLASLNDMHPFYAVGSSLSVVTTALFIGTRQLLIAYSVFVTTLGLALFIDEPNQLKAPYWGGMLPVLFLAYQRLSIQQSQGRALREQVRERTLQLEEANEKLRMEIEERTRLEEQLRTTNKIEAVGRLAGGVAHDFNNLLTTIGIYSELVLDGLGGGSPLRREVEQIQKANRQATAITQQLLTVGRRGHVDVEFTDLNQGVSKGVSMLRHLLGADTKIELRLSDSPQPIWGDPQQLQQILINLALNARDAMNGPGVFTVETDRVAAQQLLEQNVAETTTGEEYVRLAVSDTGAGMTPEARDRAFDPFFTTKDSEGGAGLGLSIVHGIISRADGFVRLLSEPGEGSRFELYWPLAMADAADTVSEGAFRGRREEILLVEDEADLRDALNLVLVNNGYVVTQAASGEDALEIASQRARRFDLVITDVVMPGINGFELAERLAKLSSDVKILLVSGHLNDDALEHLPSELPFLAKPFSARELAAQVRALIDG
jgi:signal transduction histidine kinase/CheY-like chemotaxis protein